MSYFSALWGKFRRAAGRLPSLSREKAAALAGRFALAFLLSGTGLFGRFYPFGLAFVSLSGPKLPGLCALLGCVGGSFLFMDFSQALRLSAVAVLIFAASTALYDTGLFRLALFAPLNAALMTVLVSFVYLSQAEKPWSAAALMLLEALCAAVCCLLYRRLPQRKKAAPKRLTEQSPPPGQQLKQQLERAAAAFRELYESCGRTSPETEENPSVVFDRAAEQTCRNCALCQVCWQREYTSTFAALNDATPLMIQRGRALARDFPQHFSSRCIHFSDFLAAVNGELTALLLRRQYRLRLEESRSAAGRQYAGFSELLGRTARHVEAFGRGGGGAPLVYQIGSGLLPRRGETVCGDSVTAFESEDGLLHLLLSDGMGSGEEARRSSSRALHLLQQFLQAGIDAQAALKTLHGALTLQAEGSFTTVDLLSMSLSGGEATLYKYGAAPSYLRRRGQVSRITGQSLPAGLDADTAAPESTSIPLEKGCWLVLQSDGVCDGSDDTWLLDLLAGWQGKTAQALANRILAEARDRRQGEDDLSVLVLYLDPEEPDKRRV